MVLGPSTLTRHYTYLQAEKERLLYDMQRRGRPLDTADDRNAIQRGLLARDEQLRDTSSASWSEAGGPPPLALVRVRVGGIAKLNPD